MIDFLKILVKDSDLAENVFRNDRLIFHDRRERLSHFDFETIQAKETKQYKGILFCRYDKKLEILFRPLYYFNENLHNANDFTALNNVEVLNEFINDFQLDEVLGEMQIINLEFGINAVCPMDVRDLITFAKYHSRNEFVNDDGLKYSKKSYRTNPDGKANQYKIIKFYAKSIQFPEYAEPNLFRFEVKSKKSKYINSLGIFNLSDLLREETYQTLKSAILNEFQQVLILDSSFDIANLDKRQENKLKDYLNSDTWYRILQKQNGNRNEFTKAKKRYFELLDKSGRNIHSDLQKIVSDKLDFLTNEKGAFLPPFQKDEKGAYFPINIMGNCTFSGKRICPITGISLERENDDSKYIKTSTLKYLKTEQPETFELIRIELLKKSISRPKFERNEIRHLAKQVRNRFFNPNQFKDSGYRETTPPNQLVLF